MLKNCIKAVRKEKGISQVEMHKLTGLGHTTLSEIETGKKTNIMTDTMKLIADALGENPFDIFFWDDIPL